MGSVGVFISHQSVNLASSLPFLYSVAEKQSDAEKQLSLSNKKHNFCEYRLRRTRPYLYINIRWNSLSLSTALTFFISLLTEEEEKLGESVVTLRVWARSNIKVRIIVLFKTIRSARS
jgi:hypothetical protein